MKTPETVAWVELNPVPLLDKIRSARPYKIPKGYLSWRSLSALVTIAATVFDKPGHDPQARTVFWRMVLWLIQDAPLYCISAELLEAFAQTDILDRPGLLQGLEAPIPTFILLPPIGALKTPAGDAVEYMIIHVSDRRYPERSRGKSAEFAIDLPRLEHQEEIVVHCGVSDESGIVWFGGIGVLPDGSLQFEKNITDEHEAGDPAFMAMMRSLSLQAILALQYQPELLSDEPPPPRPKGFSRSKQPQPTCRSPRWLGKDFKAKTQDSAPGTGTHASPRTHWRRGHLRRVAIGEGRCDRKVVWIQPRLINGEA
jgi:hypothetical protein